MYVFWKRSVNGVKNPISIEKALSHANSTALLQCPNSVVCSLWWLLSLLPAELKFTYTMDGKVGVGLYSPRVSNSLDL